MKLLVIGVNGMLGNSLARAWQGEVVGTYNNIFLRDNFNNIKLDISNKAEVKEAIRSVFPDLVVNCAAVTNVDTCEDNPGIAGKVHIDGTKNLSEACASAGAKFVHISTDFVFDGIKGNYSEADSASPINVYGKTKLDGEKTLSKNDLLIRTCIFGKNLEEKKSMVEWIVGELENNKPVNVFTDSFFTPIYTGHLSEIIIDMVKKDMKGLYHVASTTRVDKLTFATAVAEIFNLDASLVRPSSIKNFERKAKRPIDTSLDCSKAKAHGIRLNDYKEEIKMMKHDWNRS